MLLKMSSSYHHSKLDDTHVLADNMTAQSDLKYCPTSTQEGEGKTYSYTRSLRAIPSTYRGDTRTFAPIYWGVPGSKFKNSQNTRKALLATTFWSKNLH
jgi:hypothetical protein